ncbi:MAG: ankyrin repeat domain-containing protein [Gammaproteobacteria bacterium]|nr:ankyrin repeat domain-containing protein [Gammaproteobacteria bacterium]
MTHDFLIAAALQQVYKVRYYIERVGLHPDTTRDGKPTALCYACMKPNLPLVDYYLDKGASVNARDAMGMTPLHYAALGGCEACLSRLIAAGAPVNQPNHGGETPLATATYRSRSVACAELLRCYGAVIHGEAARQPCFH